MACKESARLKNLDTRLTELSGVINLFATVGWAVVDQLYINPSGTNALYNAIMNSYNTVYDGSTTC